MIEVTEFGMGLMLTVAFATGIGIGALIRETRK